jgi:subtilisin family serine protease
MYAHVRTLASCALALVLVLAGCDSSEPLQSEAPEQTQEAADGWTSEAIPGQYIVVLKDDAVTAKSESAVRQLATTMLGKSGELGNTYAHSIRGFSASGLTKEEAQSLANDRRVDFIEQDERISVGQPPSSKMGPPGGGGGSDGQTTPYGITRVGGPVSNFDGEAWVLDTGIDLDHDDLNVDQSRSAVFVSKGPGAKTPNDKDGHGTHVAGTIAAIDNSRDVVGVAEGATCIAVKVLDDRGSGTYSDIIDGVDYVAQNASAGDVANMSLGGGTSNALDTAVANAASNGIFFTLAAGNSSEDASNSSPARTEATNVLTISAHDDTDTFASFSNYSGPTADPVEYAQPGVDVLSLYADNGTATLSGTSMSAPHAAGVALVNLTGGDSVQDNLATNGTVSNDPDGDPDPIAVTN